jgi:UDP:flavonoid glycosyltransferase YjiC (YdhE family)
VTHHGGMKAMITVVPMAGHVGPMSGLVRELVSREHQVRVYTGARYRQRFTDLGATMVPWSAAQDFDEDDIGATFSLARRPGLPTAVALVRDGFIGTAPGQVQDLNRELDREPADVLIADSMSFGGALTGELRGLPWAFLNVLPFNQSMESAAPPGFRVRPARGVLGRQRDRLLRQLYRTMTFPFNRAYNRARVKIGLSWDRRPYGSMFDSAWLVLATGCPSLDVPRPDLPNRVHFVGRLSPAGAILPSAPSRDRGAKPLVVVTQGTHDVNAADLIQPALEGLADMEVDVIATSGRRGRTTVGLAPPPNARILDLLDFASVLPEAAVFVTNGGWGGVLASLAAGVPMVVAAGSAADKPEIAARVARSGGGLNLRTGRPKPSLVARAVQEVLANPAYRERAQQIGSELHQLGGASTAADVVERLARTRAPVRRVGNPWSSPNGT